VRRLRQRELEYNTPRADRVYCRHQILPTTELLRGESSNIVLALTPEQIDEAEDDELDLVECGAMVASKRSAGNSGSRPLCYHCRGRNCGTCGEPLTSVSQPHTCNTTPNPTIQETADDHGQVRGKDFQLCPNPACGYPVNLSDGCNHVICPMSSCKTQYCLHLRTRSGRWQRSLSSRQGVPALQSARCCQLPLRHCRRRLDTAARRPATGSWLGRDASPQPSTRPPGPGCMYRRDLP